MDTELSIRLLQAYAAGLAAQSMQHKVQSKVFASQGLVKLAEKYAGHATEEMGWVDKFIDRIIDLGGAARVEAAPEQTIYDDPVEFIEADLEVSEREVPNLGKATLAVAEDLTTFDLLKGYYQDEEEDMYWMQTQLGLIKVIGKQEWLIRQLYVNEKVFDRGAFRAPCFRGGRTGQQRYGKDLRFQGQRQQRRRS